MVMLAADPGKSAQASMVAIQTGVETGKPTRTHVGQNVVTVLDTPEGRLLVEHVSSAGKTWMIISPGTTADIGTAVNKLLRDLPAHQEWYSHRKVV